MSTYYHISRNKCFGSYAKHRVHLFCSDHFGLFDPWANDLAVLKILGMSDPPPHQPKLILSIISFSSVIACFEMNFLIGVARDIKNLLLYSG